MINTYQLAQLFGIRPSEVDTLTNWEIGVARIGNAYESRLAKRAARPTG